LSRFNLFKAFNVGPSSIPRMRGLSGVALAICVIVTTLLPTLEAQSLVTTSTRIGQSTACSTNFCQNGGVCSPFPGTLIYYTCNCPGGFKGLFCEQMDNPGGMYEATGLVSELMDKPPPVKAIIRYNGNRVVYRDTGKDLTPTQVRYQPLSITWPDMKADHFYTIIMIDPDMPSRTTPIAQKTQVLHWLMVNIPGVGVGGRQLAPYIGSGPPPRTGIHRYTFLVFDEGTSPKDYTSIAPMNLVNIDKRVNWNFVQPGQPWTLRGFMQWANMGLPIAGNFYQAQWDSWVDQLWRTFNKFYE